MKTIGTGIILVALTVSACGPTTGETRTTVTQVDQAVHATEPELVGDCTPPDLLDVLRSQDTSLPDTRGCRVARGTHTIGVPVAARNAERGDELFLTSVDLSDSEYQTMIIVRVRVRKDYVTIILGGVGGGGWNSSDATVRLVLPPDYTLWVKNH